jgi:hypothetical protein
MGKRINQEAEQRFNAVDVLVTIAHRDRCPTGNGLNEPFAREQT